MKGERLVMEILHIRVYYLFEIPSWIKYIKTRYFTFTTRQIFCSKLEENKMAKTANNNWHYWNLHFWAVGLS